MRPFLVYEDSQGLGPCTFLSGPQWKDWDGALMVGIMAAKQTEVLQIDKEGRISKRTIPALPAERARSLVPGPDGVLYVVTDEGSIWKIRAP
jgi:glucose/arabinose dehydrogenase